MQRLSPGQDVRFAEPADVGASYDGFFRNQLRAIALAQAGIAFVGSALVNVLIPPPKPSAVTSSFGSAPAPSPTYSLQAHGNHARLAQPIPVIYGRHLVFPDLAATPWAEHADNDQYLHQLHCIGQGQYDLEQVRIEDTPIASFEEIETEIVPPGGAVTLFETDVVNAPEVAGQELIGANDRETAVTTNDAGEKVTTVVGDGGRSLHRQPGRHRSDCDRHRRDHAARALLRQ